MKRTVKKHISLLLAALMLFTSVGFNAVAADGHIHQTDVNNPTYCKVINPTCDEQGYTEYYCVTCGELASVGAYTKALGHTYGEDKYEEVEGGYNRYQECTRQYTVDGELKSCTSKSYETENGEKTLYHLVRFYNNKVTKAYDPTITYTKVASEFEVTELYSCYVKHGEEAVYEGKINPYREKTRAYSKYEWIGWTDDASLDATDEKNLTEADCIDLSKVEKNLDLYPVFEGYKGQHSVVFYNLDGIITWPQDVIHGEAPKYSDPNGNLYPTPEKEEDINNYYKFNGWSTELYATSGIPNDEIESTPVYGDAHFRPSYEPVAKRYTLEFYDETGENLLRYDGKLAVFKGINLGVNFYEEKGVYSNALSCSKTELEKAGDKTYYYVWTGNWRVMRADGTLGTVVDFTDFEIVNNDIINELDADGNVVYLDGTLAEGLTDNNKEPSKLIRLVPVFERRLKVYTVDIEMEIPYGEDSDYYRGEADVHVVANNDQLVASGKTDANGKFRCRLNYQVPFTVTVATKDGKYIGTATISELMKPNDDTGNADIEAEINKCRVSMQLNPEYETHCRCIHHNALLQPIFVRILNLLYTFFNVKYVCCYDMASTIGPLLDYVDGSGNIIP